MHLEELKDCFGKNDKLNSDDSHVSYNDANLVCDCDYDNFGNFSQLRTTNKNVNNVATKKTLHIIIPKPQEAGKVIKIVGY